MKHSTEYRLYCAKFILTAFRVYSITPSLPRFILRTVCLICLPTLPWTINGAHAGSIWVPDGNELYEDLEAGTHLSSYANPRGGTGSMQAPCVHGGNDPYRLPIS